MPATPNDRPADPEALDTSGDDLSRWQAGFNEYLLGGVVGLMIFSLAFAVGLFLLPGDYLRLSELQPAARVAAEKDFPVGGSRVVTWGQQVILVVHSSPQEYHALEGTSPLEGCILKWDAASLRVISPCNFLVYDLHGNVVRGLTTVPLQRYNAFVRQGTVYVTGR